MSAACCRQSGCRRSSSIAPTIAACWSRKDAMSPALIPGARFVELPGEDHLPFVGDQDAMLDEIEEFLTGSSRSLELDRVLATVMCVRASAAGDGETAACARPDLIDRFYAHARKELDWFRGGGFAAHGTGFHQHLRRTGPRHPVRVRAHVPPRRASASTSESASTPANAMSGTTRSRASPSTWPPRSRRMPPPARCWSRGP